jgi:putative copper resistance protein D
MTPIRLHTLIFGVQADPLGLVSDGVAAAVCIMYGLGARRERRRRRRWPGFRSASFCLGVLTLWIATGSGLAAYDDSNVRLHVVQHVLLMMVVPPLLALARPLTLFTRASSWAPFSSISRSLRRRAVRIVAGPAVAATLYIASMYAYWLDRGMYNASLQHPLVHAADHLFFLLVGFLYWDNLLGEHPTRGSDGAERILAALVIMPFEAILGVLMTLQQGRGYGLGSTADGGTAGRLFVILAMVTSGSWLLVMFGQWIRRSLRRERAVAAGQADALTPGTV